MDLELHLEEVGKFQKAFGLDFNENLVMLTEDQIALRKQLMLEEINEYKEAETELEKFDAVLDMLFLTCGDIVVMGGQKLINVDDLAEATILEPFLSDIATVEMIEDSVNADYTSIFGYLNSRINNLASCLEIAQINEFFSLIDDGLTEVFNSNMSKLGVDGKAIINGVNCPLDETRPHGKVLKGPNFFEPRLQEILNKK